MLCRDATLATGAILFEAACLDAAVLVTGAPGAYAVQVSGGNNFTGGALLEIYEGHRAASGGRPPLPAGRALPVSGKAAD